MERRLAAIFAADMVGYSRLMAADESGTIARQRAHRKDLIDPIIAEYGGRLVKSTGDGVLVEFSSVVDALRCAVSIQLAMSEYENAAPENRRIEYRIGINLGEIIVEDGDIYGDGVNIASRLEGLAEPGGICVARNVYNQVKGKVVSGFESLGEKKVKNIPEPIPVFRVLMKSEISGDAERGRQIGKWWRRPVAAIVALGFVVVVVIFGVVMWQLQAPVVAPAPVEPTTLPLPDKPSIAVLPFDNLSDDPEQEYFADGITDDLITDLSKLSGVFVISRNSAFTYKDRAVNVPDIARELGVRYVLEGSVRRDGEAVRINAQLIDGTTGGHVWADRYNGTLDDIFALQDQVIGQIVAQLKVKLTNTEQGQLARIPTTSLEAYDNYLRAEQEGYYIAESTSYRRILEFYRKAIELDPKFADAFSGYARALIEIMSWGYDDVMPGPVARKEAYEAAGRALDLDSENARAYAVLAFLQMLDGRHREAVESARRAVSKSPSDAEARTNLGLVLAYAGQPVEAVSEVEAALRLNPKPPPGVLLIAGLVFYFDGQYERAIEALESARAEQPTSEVALEFLAASYGHLGDLQTARKLRNELIETFPVANLAYYRLFYQHWKRESDIDHHIAGLERAGVPPWPYGYQSRPEDQLDGRAIEALTLGKRWNGSRYSGVPFVQEISDTGAFAYSSALSLATGSLWIEGNQLCQRVEGYLFGRAVCGYVYRNTDENADQYQFVYVEPDSVRYFSVSE